MTTETDRELLEWAAKAAGIKATKDPYGQWRNCTNTDPAMDIFAFPLWNPITDDGDALRLAVKLGMYVNIEGMEIGYRLGCVLNIERMALADGGLYAATRRAIVRAAAAIGKEMKE